ncbi:MAG: DUF4422 domain-containing protein [Selenomonadaceae bacterium]|nr:DUF4422 domain-containing protein [Selenomonadaceae bacterium]
MVVEIIKNRDSFYIYGAQVVAYGAYTAIRHLCGKLPQGFIVNRSDGNPEDIEGIPVCSRWESIPRESLIIVAVTELLHEEIAKALEAAGFTKLFLLTQHEEHLLMSAYFESIGRFPMAKLSTDATFVDLAIYEVRNHRDKPLSTRPPLNVFEHTIQAGAAITEDRIAKIMDHTGKNISAKNRQYCEMTATYWVWKNTDHDWKGIEHYRRHLLVKQEMLTSDVDAILPLPYICYPNTLSQFRRFVSEDVLQALLQVLRELHPSEYDGYLSILRGQYQYTYNLVCAKAEVFDDYCAWFFRITEHMEGMADIVPDIEKTRALSYVAEVLTNLYFMSHQDVWRIQHVEKAIYV